MISVCTSADIQGGQGCVGVVLLLGICLLLCLFVSFLVHLLFIYIKQRCVLEVGA